MAARRCLRARSPAFVSAVDGAVPIPAAQIRHRGRSRRREPDVNRRAGGHRGSGFWRLIDDRAGAIVRRPLAGFAEPQPGGRQRFARSSLVAPAQIRNGAGLRRGDPHLNGGARLDQRPRRRELIDDRSRPFFGFAPRNLSQASVRRHRACAGLPSRRFRQAAARARATGAAATQTATGVPHVTSEPAGGDCSRMIPAARSDSRVETPPRRSPARSRTAAAVFGSRPTRRGTG